MKDINVITSMSFKNNYTGFTHQMKLNQIYPTISPHFGGLWEVNFKDYKSIL